MYMNPDCSVCFSATFPCASQLHHLVLLSIIILCFLASSSCASQHLCFLLPALMISFHTPKAFWKNSEYGYAARIF